MNIREWIIRKLGGIPLPKEYAKLHLMDGHGFIIISGYSDDIIEHLGGVFLPEPGEGQYVVGPVVRKKPVRTPRNMNEMAKRTGKLVKGS